MNGTIGDVGWNVLAEGVGEFFVRIAAQNDFDIVSRFREDAWQPRYPAPDPNSNANLGKI